MTYGNYPDLSDVKKILVIKLRHHGDVLLTSPVFSNLKKALPTVVIDALIYQETLPMLEGHPSIDDFLLYDQKWKKEGFFKRGMKELSLLKKIYQGGYDLILNLTEGDRGAIAAFVSRAKIRVGLDPGKKGFWNKRKIFTHLVKSCPTPRHTVEKNLDALRKIGIFPEEKDRELTLEVSAEVLDRMKERLPKDFVVIHPVSRWRFKCWPVSHVAGLISALSKQGHQVVMTASPDPVEMAMVDEILTLAPTAHVINLAGKISLKELAATINLSRGLVCVDSVPLHIASVFKTPVVALFGPTSDLNWGPWRHPRGVVVAKKISCRPCLMDGCGGSKMSDCLHTLPVDAVLNQLLKLIAQPNSESLESKVSLLRNERSSCCI